MEKKSLSKLVSFYKRTKKLTYFLKLNPPEVYKTFFEFLEKENVLDEYIKNVINEKKATFWSNRAGFIIAAFLWDDTKKWNEIHNKWHDILREKDSTGW